MDGGEGNNGQWKKVKNNYSWIGAKELFFRLQVSSSWPSLMAARHDRLCFSRSYYYDGYKVIEAFLAFERELNVKGMAEPKLINCFLFISGACHT